MIITIDGYAGSGKSTAAVRLANLLGFELLNTGAMYRATAFSLKRAGIDIDADPRNIPAIERHMESLVFKMESGRTDLNGEDLTEIIKSEELGAGASRVGTFPEVREKLKAEQRRIARGRKIICEGRDQGTSVFPEAQLKFFFRADVDVRARRRAMQLEARGEKVDLDVIRENIKNRDYQDETRAIDPLRRAPDAICVDSSNLSEDQVLEILRNAVEKCLSTV